MTNNEVPTNKEKDDGKPYNFSELDKKEFTKQDYARVKEDENETPMKWWMKLIQGLAIIGLLGLFVYIIYLGTKFSTPDNKTLIMWIVILAGSQIMILFLLIGTGIGIEACKRFINKIRYKSGNYANVLHIMKTGVIKERFVKIDPETGKISMRGHSYALNPLLAKDYKGIKTYFHREGVAQPVNVWEDRKLDEISCAEVDEVMYAAGTLDVLAWLKKILLVLVIGLGLIFMIVGFNAYQDQKELKKLDTGNYTLPSPLRCIAMPEIINGSIVNIPNWVNPTQQATSNGIQAKPLGG